jgi:hypothetical protein
MSSNSFVSLLARFDWFFLAGWIVLLATASAFCFSEESLEISRGDRRVQDPECHR